MLKPNPPKTPDYMPALEALKKMSLETPKPGSAQVQVKAERSRP